MKSEQIKITEFPIDQLTNLAVINRICRGGYLLTNNKFDVIYSGSKGYVDSLIIQCEGYQPKQTNRIVLSDYITKRGPFMRKTVEVFYSDESGVTLNVK